MTQRVARSRDLVAEGHSPSVVARVAQISRQADLPDTEAAPLAATPAGHRSGRRCDRRDREELPDRRLPDDLLLRPSPARCRGQPQAGAAGDARAEADRAPAGRGAPAPARRLQGRAPRAALAPRHDQRVGRRTRLDLSERDHRLLHPRDRRLVTGAALPRRRGDRADQAGSRRASGSCRARSRSAPTTAPPLPPARPGSRSARLGVTHRRGGYRDPESQAFIESWFRYLKERCVWRNEFETLDQAREVIAAYIDHYHDRPHSRLNYQTPREVRATWDDATGSPTKNRGLNRQHGTGAVQSAVHVRLIPPVAALAGRSGRARGRRRGFRPPSSSPTRRGRRVWVSVPVRGSPAACGRAGS